MDQHQQFDSMLEDLAPILALAPMQDVTDLPFWRLIACFGGADVYFSEYFRIHTNSRLEKPILKSITENPTGQPIVAQLIGNDIPSLVRSAKELQQYPIAGIDLNLGCPAPVVYKKCAGGGLLREPAKIDAILGELRKYVTIKLSVKSRIGFDSPEVFDELLAVFARHELDLLTVHGRTVKEMYRSEVHYEFIAQAVEVMNCPVLANGNIHSPENAETVLRKTGARGLMIGRGVIRNPWLFEQIRQRLDGRPVILPTGRDVLDYVRELYETTTPPSLRVEKLQVRKMKKYMNYIGLGVDPDGEFLKRIRRVSSEREFFAVCSDYLDHSEPMTMTPYALRLRKDDLLAGCHR